MGRRYNSNNNIIIIIFIVVCILSISASVGIIAYNANKTICKDYAKYCTTSFANDTVGFAKCMATNEAIKKVINMDNKSIDDASKIGGIKNKTKYKSGITKLQTSLKNSIISCKKKEVLYGYAIGVTMLASYDKIKLLKFKDFFLVNSVTENTILLEKPDFKNLKDIATGYSSDKTLILPNDFDRTIFADIIAGYE